MSSLTKKLKIDWSKKFDNIRGVLSIKLSTFLLVIVVLPAQSDQIIRQDW